MKETGFLNILIKRSMANLTKSTLLYKNDHDEVEVLSIFHLIYIFKNWSICIITSKLVFIAEIIYKFIINNIKL